MDKNYEIGDLVWETKIPAKLKIHHLNLGSDIEPPLFYVNYFSFRTSEKIDKYNIY